MKNPLRLCVLCAFVVLTGCASVSQTLESDITSPDGTREKRTLTVRVRAAGDAKQALEKMRASNGKTLTIGVEGSSQETSAPQIELLWQLLKAAAKP